MAGGGGTLVLGVGNILWADEGFGVRALEALAARYEMPEGITLIDGGTQGLALIPALEAHARLLLLDAVDFGGVPASLAVVRDGAIPQFIASRAVSLHQTGMQEVLALAHLSGWQPQAMTLIGVQPVELEDFGGSLSEGVRARLDETIGLAVEELTTWGFALVRRPSQRASDLLAPALALQAYEEGRPSAAAACRIGDARVLPPGREV